MMVMGMVVFLKSDALSAIQQVQGKCKQTGDEAENGQIGYARCTSDTPANRSGSVYHVQDRVRQGHVLPECGNIDTL